MIDDERLREYRLERAREQLRRHGLAAALLFDPDNVRYTTTRGIVIVWNLHGADRWALVPVDSEPVLWEYPPAIHVTEGRVSDIRPARGFRPFGSGPLTTEHAREFAREIVAELDSRGLMGERIGIDRLDAVAFLALAEAGVEIADAQLPLELARAVKSPDEIAAMQESAGVCDAAIGALRERMLPGATEDEIWAAFSEAAFARGAEYIESRLLASGPRTNPWFQEASSRVVEAGDLVAFDTDMIGARGYLCDVSRTYLCGDGSPTDEQRRLHAIAYEFVHEAIPHFRPGVSLEELGRMLSERMPEEFHPLRYPLIAHGSGLSDEYPSVLYDEHHPGELEESMVVSVEAYVGAEGGREGVKLEEQILITVDGCKLFSSAPYDERLLP